MLLSPLTINDPALLIESSWGKDEFKLPALVRCLRSND